MDRTEINRICEIEVLETAARLFGTSKNALGKFDDYDACANLVYHYQHKDPAAGAAHHLPPGPPIGADPG